MRVYELINEKIIALLNTKRPARQPPNKQADWQRNKQDGPRVKSIQNPTAKYVEEVEEIVEHEWATIVVRRNGRST